MNAILRAMARLCGLTSPKPNVEEAPKRLRNFIRRKRRRSHTPVWSLGARW